MSEPIERLRPYTAAGIEGPAGYLFHCPGCKFPHDVRIQRRADEPGPLWTFNGDVDKPTFSPSLIAFRSEPENTCHLFIREGKIEFLGDCFHELKNQIVDIPPFQW